MMHNRNILSLPESPLRYIEDAGTYSIYEDRDGEEYFLQHGTGNLVIPFDEINLLNEWRVFEGTISPFATNLATVTRRRRFLAFLAERTYELDMLDEVGFCADCGQPSVREDLESTYGGHGEVCGSCIDQYYWCEDCDERFPEVVGVLPNGERLVCDSCRDANYTWCEDCDYYYRDVDSGQHDHEDDDEEDNEDDGCCSSPALSFTIRNDGHDPLHNDQQVTITLPAGEISDVGMGEIARLVREQGQEAANAYNRAEITYEEYCQRHSVEATPWANLSYTLVDQVGTKWQRKDGNFTKRLSRHAHKQFGLKVPPSLLSEIGNIASNHSRAIDHRIAVTRDLNLPARDFAHGGSCWWSCYSNSRCALKSNGGFGLRTFDEYGYVIGRAWVMPLKQVERYGQLTLGPTFNTEDPDAFVVFNGYGNLDEYVAPRIVAHMAGMTYRRISFECSPMYVNSGSGTLVASEEIAARYTDGHLGLDLNQHSNLFRTEQREREAAEAAAQIAAQIDATEAVETTTTEETVNV